MRTRFVGHLRDVRRLIVAMSRARLGLYVFCRRSLFEQCYELQPTFHLLLQRPDHLGLNLQEFTAFTDRRVDDTGSVQLISGPDEMADLVNYRMHEVYQVFPYLAKVLFAHDHCLIMCYILSNGLIFLLLSTFSKVLGIRLLRY